MGKQKACFIFSGVLIAIGMLAVAIRGKDILNIDFTGGTSVTFQTKPTDQSDDLRALTRKILDKDSKGEYIQSTLVSVEKEPEDSV